MQNRLQLSWGNSVPITPEKRENFFKETESYQEQNLIRDVWLSWKYVSQFPTFIQYMVNENNSLFDISLSFVKMEWFAL